MLIQSISSLREASPKGHCIRALTTSVSKTSFKAMSASVPFVLCLRALLVAVISTLFVSGAAMAHGGHRDGTSTPTYSTGYQRAPLAEAATAKVGIEAVVIAVADAASKTPSLPCPEGPAQQHEHGSCCATACHAAVESLGACLLLPVRMPALFPEVTLSVLRGEKDNPGDRPPRFI